MEEQMNLMAEGAEQDIKADRVYTSEGFKAKLTLGLQRSNETCLHF